MDSERNISATRSELDYRAKHFHDIRVVKDNQILCGACGKKINVKTGKLHTHPYIGILQCEECQIFFDDIEFSSDDEGNDKYCRSCGHNKPLVICKKQSCHLGFCKKCIERNTGSVPSTKSKGWKCFFCHPEPLWKQRAICAAVMDAYAKRCNRKKSSRGNSKDIDDNALPHIKQQYAHTKRLQKNLQAICDDEEEEDTNNLRMRPLALPISRKVVDKNRHSNRKNMTEDQNINEDTKSNKIKRKQFTMDSSPSSDTESTTSDDLSDIDFSKPARDKKRSANDRNVKKSHKDISDTSKPNFALRSKKSSAGDKKSQHKALRSDDTEEFDVDSDDSTQVVTSSHVKGRTKRQKQSDTDNESEEEEEGGPSNSINKTKKIQNRFNKSSVNKPQHKGLAQLQSENESSSGKEFQQSKFQRSKFKPLRRPSDIDKDYTQVEELDTASKRKRRMIGEKEGKLLKSYFNKKLGEIQDVTVLNLSRWRQKNNEHKILSQEDAHEMVRKTEKVVSKLRKMLDKTWHDMSIFYQIRCKKQNQHDVEVVLSDVLTDIELDEEGLCVKKTACKLEDASGKENSIVSDCDSGEIFSDDENRKSNQSKARRSSRQAESDSDKSVSSFHNSTKCTENTPTKERDLHSPENENKGPSETSTSRKSVDDSKDDSDVDMGSPVFETRKSKEQKSKPTAKPEIKTKEKSTDDLEVETSPLENTGVAEKYSNSTKDLLNDSNDIFDMSDVVEDLPAPSPEENPEKSKCDGMEVTTSREQAEVTEPPVDASVDDVLGGEKTGEENQNNSVTPDDTDKEQASEQEAVNDSNAFDNNKIDTIADVIADVQNTDKKLPNPDDARSDSDINSVSTVCYQDFVKDVSEAEKVDEENDSGNSEVPEISENSELDAELKAKRALLLSDTDSSVELETKCEETKSKRDLLLSSSESTTSDNDIIPDASSSVETDRNSVKTSLKRNRDVESDTSLGIRTRRKRFKLDKSQHYLNDEKLRMVCQVRVARLPKKILRRYKRALERSRRNVESKEIESLVDLDKLKKKQRKCTNDDSDDNNPSSRSRRRRKPNANEKEDSLLDHLERIENGEELDITDKSSEKDNDQQGKSGKSTILGNDDLISLMNQEEENNAKQFLLRVSDSSSEEITAQNDVDDKDTDPKEKKKPDKNRKETGSRKKSSEETQNSSEEEKGQDWRRDKLLTMKFSDSDTEKETEKWNKSRERRQSKESENNPESLRKTRSKKKKGQRRILDSDSDKKNSDSDSNSDSLVILSESKESASDSEDVKKKKKKQRKRQKSSDTDSSLEGKKSKPKRKRIKQPVADSDSDSENMQTSQESPCKSGRKNIRKVLKDKQVADDTKQAAKEEEDRLKRIAERQKLYNEIYEMKLASEEKVEKVVLDFDPETKKELVTVHEDLVKRLKPHQAKGIKFMWDACFESLERVKKDSKGSGCILAHCMGLGKTLQVIALSHTLLTHEETGIKTVMVVCPLSTVLNWVNEFHMWLKDVNDDDTIEVFELTKSKKNYERMYQLEQWQRVGGVLIIGYEMFRNLSNASKKMRKSMRESILRNLVDPGADLVVCDEGHLLKNEDSALSKCMKQVKTLRRIVLTGTPLQNNLFEYHCMVQFVKPNLLGTKKEFSNRFVQPITNGQFDDSTPSDVKLMKKRAHVLHKMLEGSVQRFDYSVLTPFLPPKQEYVIFVRLTEVQIKIYQYYLDNFARKSRSVGGSLFADFQELQRIWTHPIVLRLNAEKIERANDRKHLSSESEGSLKDFIDDGDSDSSSSDSDVQSIDSSGERMKRSTRSNPVAEEPEPVVKEEEPKTEWWTQFVEPEHFQDMRISGKLMLLFEILKESEQIGDKVLVFSQSLYSLTLIEEFLSRIDEETQNGESSEFLEGHAGNWTLGVDYFRLDGQTSPEYRNIWCKEFNKPSNTRARLFLISTRAGGLGINLTAANRVIIFDASWNPSHDVQSIFRIYRFGQKKPCYVYRLLAYGTMEEKIYNRQVTKLSLSCRVVDEQQIERHYSTESLSELYSFQVHSDKEKSAFQLPKDMVLANILLKYKELVENFHEHDSLLENRAEEELNEEDRKQAWLEYEEEKKGRPAFVPTMPNGFMMQPNMLLNTDESIRNEFEILQQLIRKDYPNLAPEMQNRITQQTLSGMYSYMERQVGCAAPQVPLGGNMAPRNIMPQNVHGSLINNPQNVLSLFQQNPLAVMQAQRQFQQRANYDAHVLNANQPVQSAIINVEDTQMPSTTRNVQLPAQSSGNSKGQEE